MKTIKDYLELRKETLERIINKCQFNSDWETYTAITSALCEVKSALAFLEGGGE